MRLTVLAAAAATMTACDASVLSVGAWQPEMPEEAGLPTEDAGNPVVDVGSIVLDDVAADGASTIDASCGGNLTGLLRDFHRSPPEFEGPISDDRGLVRPMLGPDSIPVYAGPSGGTITTSGEAKFDTWYRDVPGVNMRKPYTIPFQSDGKGVSTYANPAFFPIDNDLFGNEGYPHNYHFTFELHTAFVYKLGDTFRFRGDDDLWLFINDRLVVDLGGVHSAEEAAIFLDQLASTIGLVVGEEYKFDLFYNERHTVASEIEIQMTLTFQNCGIIPR
jgi:fibro-slime domain-containing protein